MLKISTTFKSTTTHQLLCILMLISTIFKIDAGKREKIVRITIEHVDVPNGSKYNETVPNNEGHTFLMTEEAIDEYKKEIEEEKKKEIKTKIIKKLSRLLNKVREIKQKDFVDDGEDSDEVIPPARLFRPFKHIHHHANLNKKHHLDQSAGMNVGDNMLLVEEPGEQSNVISEPIIEAKHDEVQNESELGLFENGHVDAQYNGDKTIENNSIDISRKYGDKKYQGDKSEIHSTNDTNKNHEDSQMDWNDLLTEIKNFESFKSQNENLNKNNSKTDEKSVPEKTSSIDEDKHMVDVPLNRSSSDDVLFLNDSQGTQVSFKNNERDKNELSTKIKDVTSANNSNFKPNASSEHNEVKIISVPEKNEDDFTVLNDDVSLTRDKEDKSFSSNVTHGEENGDKNNSSNMPVSVRNETTTYDTQIVNVSEIENYGDNQDKTLGNIGDKNDWGNGTPDVDSENKHYWDNDRKTKVNINNVNYHSKDFSTSFFFKSMQYDGDKNEKPLEDDKFEKSSDAELRELSNSVMNLTSLINTTAFSNVTKEAFVSSNYSVINQSKVDISLQENSTKSSSKVNISSLENSNNTDTGQAELSPNTESLEHFEKELDFLNASSKRGLKQHFNRSLDSNNTTNNHTLKNTNEQLLRLTAKDSIVVNDICAQKHAGTYANPDDCTHYWLCAGGKRYETQCPNGLVYNTRISSCDDPSMLKDISLSCQQRLHMSTKVEN